jgi:hypothetical protein
MRQMAKVPPSKAPLRLQELQGNWTSEFTRGVEQRFGGKLFGLQVQLDDGRLSADLKAQELWADGKLRHER